MLSVELARRSGLLVVDRTRYGLPGHGSVPVFADVEDAIRALRSVVDYSEWLSVPRGTVPQWSGMERNRAHQLAVEAVAAAEQPDTSSRLTPEIIEQILASYGIEVWAALAVTTEDEAVTAAEQLGYPVVLKSSMERLVHRTDLGGLRLTLENEHALRTAYLSMSATLPPEASGRLVVQRMALPALPASRRPPRIHSSGPSFPSGLAGSIPQS